LQRDFRCADEPFNVIYEKVQSNGEKVEELIYIETEISYKESQLLICGDQVQENFRTLEVDERGGQYKLKSSEGKLGRLKTKTWKFFGRESTEVSIVFVS
jgi:hypothetical protein